MALTIMEPLRIKRGFSLVEVILATAVFALLVTALAGIYVYGEESTALSGNRARAVFLAEEGLEAARNIRDANFNNLTLGTHGIALSGDQWTLSGTSGNIGIFTRSITVTSLDADRKTVTSTVSWQQNQQRTGSVTLTTRLSNWQDSAPPVASCNEYAIQEGYAAGTCRTNVAQCNRYDEVPLSSGNQYCSGGPPVDTCCALP